MDFEPKGSAIFGVDGGFFRASLLLFGTVALGCGGEATGDDADAAPSDSAAGKDVATDVRHAGAPGCYGLR